MATPHPPTHAALDAGPWFAGFDDRQVQVGAGIHLRTRVGGHASGQPLLLLHGFPQTHALWHRVAQRLAPHFRLILADLRGYGGSSKPQGAADHGNYSKRSMAADLHTLMCTLGYERYAVAGHDRGGRVAHRLALDQPLAVTRLCVLDIAPTLDMYQATNQAFATAYYHWFHLIQPAPLPERMITPMASEYLQGALGKWGTATGGTPLAHVEPLALADYEAGFCSPAGVHSACEDYRASAGIDLEHDRASRAAGQKLACPLLVLVGERGVVNKMFNPHALWAAQCSAPVATYTLPCGHYLPEEQPEQTAEHLVRFFAAA